VILDYFGASVPVDRAHEARVIEASIGGSPVVGIRAARGLNRDLPWHPMRRSPDAEPTPLAHLPPFAAFKPKRSRKKKPAGEPDPALRDELVDRMQQAARDCDGEWRDRWDRSPHREELAHALAVVLRAQPDVYVCDPGRAANIAMPQRPRAAPAPRSSERTVTWREHPGVLQAIVTDPSGDWSVLLAIEDGAVLADVLGGNDGAGETVLSEILPAWRARGAAVPDDAPVWLRPMRWGEPVRLR
jgi:hypothetical protein